MCDYYAAHGSTQRDREFPVLLKSNDATNLGVSGALDRNDTVLRKQPIAAASDECGIKRLLACRSRATG